LSYHLWRFGSTELDTLHDFSGVFFKKSSSRDRFFFCKKRERQRVNSAGRQQERGNQPAHRSRLQTLWCNSHTAAEKCKLTLTNVTCRLHHPGLRSKPFNAAPRCRHPAHGLLRRLYRHIQLFF
jgi:hypothetical protein